MAITDAKATIGLPVGATNVLTSAGAAATVRYVPVGENLLTNGGFETDTTGWNAVSSGVLTRDTVTYKLGAASLKVEKSPSIQTSAKSDTFTVTPGATYQIAMWGKLGTATDYSARITWFSDAAGTTEISDAYLVIPSETSTAWVHRSARAAAPASAVVGRVQLALSGTSGQTAFFDGITLQPCVPLAVSPYTVPTVIGDYAGGSFTYDVSPGAHYLGDVHVYDMDAQTDATLARSSYTRVYDTRHTFTGDVLVDNGVMRLWFKTGYSVTNYGGPIRFSVYTNGAWSTVQTAAADTCTNTTASVSSITLNAVNGGAVTVTTVDALSNTATWTLKRGAFAAKCVTSRYSNSAANQHFEIQSAGIPQRWGLVNASTVHYDDDLDTTTTYTTNPTEPYAVMVDDAYPYLSAIGFAGMPADVIFALNDGPIAQYTTTATNGEQRTFWLIVMPWPWLTNGKYFVEAESATLGGTAASAADAGASGGNTCTLIANADTTDYTVVGTRDLPLGDYTLVVRAKDTAQVASDCTLSVYNTTDSASLVSSAKTLTASYAYYTADFTVDANEGSDNIRVRAAKSTATANTISVDYFLIVPRKRNSDTPTHVHFPYDVAHDALMDTSTTHTIRKVT